MNDDLKILITGTLNTGKSIGEINTAIKGIEKKIQSLKLNVDVNPQILKTLTEFNNASQKIQENSSRLNKILREEEIVTKNLDGSIDKLNRKYAQNGEILEKTTKIFDNRKKATDAETDAINRQKAALENLGDIQKKVTKTNRSGNVTGSSETYKKGTTNTTVNFDKNDNVTGSRTVENIDKERKATELLNLSKQKLKQSLNILNNEGKVSADNLAKLNNAIDNSSNIQQVKRLEDNLNNLNRIRENENKLELARQQASLNVQKIKTTHGSYVDNDGLNKYTESVNALTPRTANLNQQLKSTSMQFNQVAQNARTAAGAANQAGMSFGEMLSTAMTKFPIWMISATLFYAPIRALQDMSTRLVEIDTQMVGLQRVMDMPDFKFNELLHEAVDTADELSNKLTDVLSIMNEFGRMGFEDDQLLDITKTAQMLQNISDLDSEAAVNTLTSAMLNFNIAAEDSVTIADKLNEVDLK